MTVKQADGRAEIDRLRRRLSGPNFKNLLNSKKITKYRIVKDTGITYQTLCKWQRGNLPSEENAIRIGQYLGLIDADAETIIRLEKRANEIISEIKRLKGGGGSRERLGVFKETSEPMTGEAKKPAPLPEVQDSGK